MQNQNSLHFFRETSPLLLAIFIDGMGLGLLFPILNTLLTSPTSGFFTHAVAPQTQNFLFGLTVSIFMLCWFFGAAYLGDLSDAIGRKKSLMICLIGATIGYIISAIGVNAHSFSLLLIGRMIAGFTAGSQPIAQAAIIDISAPDMKTRNIGLILLAASLGFIFGPLCGAFFSDHDFLPFFNYSTPLYFSAFISLLNALLLYILFNETFTPKRDVHWQIHQAIGVFVSAFRHPKVWRLSVMLIFMLLAWSSYYSFISLYLSKRYGFDTRAIGLFMATMSCGFGVGFGWIVNILAHRFALKISIFWALIASGVLTALTAIAPKPLLPWIATPLLGITVAIAYSMILTLFSNQVDETQQGWVMGITGAISAMAFVITGIVVSLLADWQITLPMWFSGVFFVFAAIATAMLKLNHPAQKAA